MKSNNPIVEKEYLKNAAAFVKLSRQYMRDLRKYGESYMENDPINNARWLEIKKITKKLKH